MCPAPAADEQVPLRRALRAPGPPAPRARPAGGGRRTRATRRLRSRGSRGTRGTSPPRVRSWRPDPRMSLPWLPPGVCPLFRRRRRLRLCGAGRQSRRRRHSGRRGLAAYQLCDLERQVERLAGVEPRVAHGLVALLEVIPEDLFGAPEALGDVLAGELDVDPSGPDVCSLTRGEEPA